MEVVEAVEDAGGRVVSAVNDMGSGNMALWKSLGIKHEGSVCVPNPKDPTRQVRRSATTRGIGGLVFPNILIP